MTDKQIKLDGSWIPIEEAIKAGLISENRPDWRITLQADHIKRLEETLKAKEQECEELKIYIESNEQQVKEVETLVMDNDRLINELDQLKQTLTEIKNKLTVHKTLYYESKLIEKLHKEILQKISECEGNDETN